MPRLDVEDAFARCAAAGCEGVEIQLIAGQFADPKLLDRNWRRLCELSAWSGCWFFSIGTLIQMVHEDSTARQEAFA